VAFIERWEDLSRWDAIARLGQLSGTTTIEYHSKAVHPVAEIAFPSDLHRGSRSELERVASQRKVDFWAVATMQQNNVLRFGTVCALPCWIITDDFQTLCRGSTDGWNPISAVRCAVRTKGTHVERFEEELACGHFASSEY